MPEVFLIIIFSAWLYVGNLLSKKIFCSHRRNLEKYSKQIQSIFQGIKELPKRCVLERVLNGEYNWGERM